MYTVSTDPLLGAVTTMTLYVFFFSISTAPLPAALCSWGIVKGEGL